MKTKKRIVLINERPVVITKADDYTEVSLYGYNGSVEISVSREWKMGDASKSVKRAADKEEVVGVKKLIAALEEIVEHAEKW